MDVPFFPSLYTTDHRKRELRELLMRQINCALEVCLSLECLNDLQLIFQYETFIAHSHMNGDQSHQYWRTLGDVISSTFALGYHENIESKGDTPPFLIQLRKTAFARIYSADKNVALFLGRPLRMSKRFCYFQLPGSSSTTSLDSSAQPQRSPHEWDLASTINYTAETRWSALCAFVKEDIMELLFDRNRADYLQEVNTLQAMADTYWDALPSSFRLQSDIRLCPKRPVELDFLINPSEALIEIAQQMLHLVVEAVLWRDELANSGTTLSWKIAHYGLPAAGIIILAALARSKADSGSRILGAQVLQDLILLSAEPLESSNDS
ncbi:hypothetical protein NUW58_g5488 [Xylaria curta]|uniref:Uncharacterized protein n=1 Tax=Xylaria curta TaxID=42375 RepID=A0ACC1P2L4_9PEZI|nr:hypothetical protein NUW58_g5488 [Xylaria curta]